MRHRLNALSRRLAVLALVGLALAIPARGMAQGVRVFFSDQSRNPTNKVYNLSIRPNTTEELYLYVESTDGPKDAVTVELLAGGKSIDGASWKGKLDGNAPQRVLFAPAKAPAPDKPLPLAELPGGRLVIQVLDANGKPLPESTTEVRVARPRDYTTADMDFDPKTRTLMATVTATKGFTGPRCRVELDVRPQRVPFLAAKQKLDGAYGGFLTKVDDSATLTAAKLQFQPSPEKHQGLVYITVDGYERAFTFRISDDGGKPTPLEGTALQLVADPFAAPGGPGSKVIVEADNLRENDVVKLGLYPDRTLAKPDGPLVPITSDRRERLFCNPSGPGGSLLFRAAVQDWITDLETAKIFGKKVIGVQLLNKENQREKFIEVLADGTTRQVDAIKAGLLLDGSGPEDVKFVDFPKELPRGSALTLKATGHDPESGISKVVFFAGKLPPDGKIPATAIQAPGEKIKDDLYAADLPVATDKAATLDVGVQFINGVGMTEVQMAVIKLVDAKAGTASIKGKIVEGDREQPKLEVVLRDPQGVPKDKVKTDDKGTFVFKNVAPGTYQIVCVKSGSNTAGQAVVQVAAGEEKVLSDPIKLVR